MNKSSLGATLTFILGTAAITSHAAVLNTGDLLTITPGVVDHYDPESGSPIGVAEWLLVCG